MSFKTLTTRDHNLPKHEHTVLPIPNDITCGMNMKELNIHALLTHTLYSPPNTYAAYGSMVIPYVSTVSV